MCMPARRESERTNVFFRFYCSFVRDWGEDGKGCRRLSTLSGGAFSLHSSGSGRRARTTLFFPTFRHSVFLERGAEIGGFGGSLQSAAMLLA